MAEKCWAGAGVPFVRGVIGGASVVSGSVAGEGGTVSQLCLTLTHGETFEDGPRRDVGS